jgi:hypothetical protein
VSELREERLELAVAPVRRRSGRGRWAPIAWLGVLVLVAAFAVAGQRGGDAPAAVAPPPVAELTPAPSAAPSEPLIARVPPPWVTDRLVRPAPHRALGEDGVMGSLTQDPPAGPKVPSGHFYVRSLNRVVDLSEL